MVSDVDGPGGADGSHQRTGGGTREVGDMGAEANGADLMRCLGDGRNVTGDASSANEVEKEAVSTSSFSEPLLDE